jgi:hypothetical protein
MFTVSQLCSSLVARCVQYRRFFSVNQAYRSEFHVYLQPDVYRGTTFLLVAHVYK